MKKTSLWLLAFMLYTMALTAKTYKKEKLWIEETRVENFQTRNGWIALSTNKPRFSWTTNALEKNVWQTGYHILVASTQENLSKNIGDLWDSGIVNSQQQLWVNYGGKTLRSNDRVYWKVKVYTNKGETAWSSIQVFQIALLNETRWSGRWIGLEQFMPGETAGLHTRLAARYLRKEFTLEAKTVLRATAYVAGLGLHEFYINGRKVGEDVLSPVPSDYRKTIYFNTFDVTSMLHGKKVALGIVLGNGRFFPMRQNKPYKAPVFGFPKCRINVLVEYSDGTLQKWVTDESWKVTAEGPIRSNNEYDGEIYDARKVLTGWNEVGFDDSKWMQAQRTDIPTGVLTAQTTPGMNVRKEISPVKITGNIVDFGQNMAGWVALNVHGKAGDTIRIKYAERLQENGKLYTENLRDAQSEDIYVCNGKEQGQVWHPIFVYHGFRYVEITGVDALKPADVKAQVVSDEMTSIGTFACSDNTLNRIMQNAWWGIISNYKGMPVDCPQRNERQPWLGDRTIGSLGESYLFDNERLYSKWMRDICEAQRSDGNIPDVAPAFWNYYTDDVTWPAALPFTCDMLYNQFGNITPIEDAYPAMMKWWKHMVEEYAVDGIIGKDKYGDWCVPPEKLELIHSADPARQTDGSLIATAYGIGVTQLLQKFALLQGFKDDAAELKLLETQMKAAFNRKFLTVKPGSSPRPGHVLYPDSTFYGNNTVTANILPLVFNIVPNECKDEIVKNVVNTILTQNNGHVSCGVIGISWLMRALSNNGFADVAYILATNRTYPSWGYMVENGATTIWELWNGDKASPKMNSGNHVMLLGDLVTWAYQYIGGIRNADNSVAYKHVVLKPAFEIPDCFNADVSYKTPYGTLKSKWNKSLEALHWEVAVPVNTDAELHFPDGSTKVVSSGTHIFDVKIPSKHPAVVEKEFLYNEADFPQAHAATIVERANGDLVAAYFGGTKERNPDVCIWVSIKKHGQDTWSKPILAADGVFSITEKDADLAGIDANTTAASHGPIKDAMQRYGVSKSYHYSYSTRNANLELPQSLKRKACWNPVLYIMPNREIWLFYKIGSTVGDWTGWLVKSKDGGKTWSQRQPLPKGFLGPIKNKPVLVNNKLVCGSSTENNGWRFHVEIFDLKTNQWHYVGPVDAELKPRTDDVEPTTPDMEKPVYKPNEGPRPIYSIQPSIMTLSDGRLMVLMRTHNGKLAQSFSSDGGFNWTKVSLSTMPSTQSGTDAVTLQDGRQVLIYNDFEALPGTKKGPRTPLDLALSRDGMTWEHVLVLENSPISQYSYPAIIQGKDGALHCIYTWRRERIAYQKIDLQKLSSSVKSITP